MSENLRDRLPEQLASAESSFAAAAEAAYRDERCTERRCDYCNTLYRGPTMHCRLACAVADAS
jgi:hypothetical protein